MNPAAPTKDPAIMSPLWLRTHPCPAAAIPEYASSSDMTAGMSAPPMGITSKSPTRAAIGARIQNGSEDVGLTASHAPRPRQLP